MPLHNIQTTYKCIVNVKEGTRALHLENPHAVFDNRFVTTVHFHMVRPKNHCCMCIPAFIATPHSHSHTHTLHSQRCSFHLQNTRDDRNITHIHKVKHLSMPVKLRDMRESVRDGIKGNDKKTPSVREHESQYVIQRAKVTWKLVPLHQTSSGQNTKGFTVKNSSSCT